jgi:site-specific DNA-methyltransferase (adenine-specific)
MTYELMLGVCLDKMKDIPDGSVEMVLCDLPYGTTACKWDTVIPFEPLWEQYRRVAKPNAAIVLTASQPFTTALIASNFNDFKYEWIWEKSVAGDCMNAKNKPMKKHENVLVFSTGTTANKSSRRMPYFPQGLKPTERKRSGTDYGVTGGSFKVPRPSHGPYVQTVTGYPTSILKFNNDSDKHHPTQKPVALMEYLIRTYTNEGETVLDNTMGSGTTGVACANTGRKFIGIEKDEGYFKIAEQRIKEAFERNR